MYLNAGVDVTCRRKDGRTENRTPISQVQQKKKKKKDTEWGPMHVQCIFTILLRGWSGGKLPVPGRPTVWMIVGQVPIALAVGAGGVVWTFLLSSILSLLLLPLFGRRPDID